MRSLSGAYCSLGSLLADMRVLLPDPLVGDAGWERVQALARRLPFYTIDTRFGFEFDLCDSDSVADFSVLVAPGSRLAAFYEQQAEEVASGLAGPGLGRFLRRQGRDPQSLLSRTGAAVILEYDLAAHPPGEHGSPGVFIMTPGAADRHGAMLHNDPAALVAALESAAGWERGAVDARQLESVWAVAEDSGLVVQAGVMPGRPLRAVRLIIQGVGHADVTGMLERLQWSGDLSLAASALSDLDGLVRPRAGLSIDLTSRGVSPRLGLELYRPAEWYQTDRAGWQSLMDRLVSNRWCLPAKAGALGEWPRIETFFGRDAVYGVRQVINHIKLVIDGDEVGVKGYAAMGLQQRSPPDGASDA